MIAGILSLFLIDPPRPQATPWEPLERYPAPMRVFDASRACFLDASGKIAMTSRLQACFDAAGSHVRMLLPAGTLLIDGEVDVKGSYMDIIGGPTTIKSASQVEPVFHFGPDVV